MFVTEELTSSQWMLKQVQHDGNEESHAPSYDRPGYSLGYDESGTGDATPIVLLHGVGSDKSAWRPQLQHFGRERRALAFDYPGYGDSDPAPEGTTRDDYAAAILSAMHELGIERAHICGLSLGGVVAIALYHAAPEHCASLILADTFAVHPDGQAIVERSRAALETPPSVKWRRAGSTSCSRSRSIRRCEARSSKRWGASIRPPI